MREVYEVVTRYGYNRTTSVISFSYMFRKADVLEYVPERALIL